MHLSKELKRMLAEHTYTSTRSMLMVAAPDMKPWSDLTENEQAQCSEAMRMWLAGLGSNEVAEEWFNRSGQLPRAIWDQLPEGPDRNVFIMAALDMLKWLIAEAELGLKPVSEPQAVQAWRRAKPAVEAWQQAHPYISAEEEEASKPPSEKYLEIRLYKQEWEALPVLQAAIPTLYEQYEAPNSDHEEHDRLVRGPAVKVLSCKMVDLSQEALRLLNELQLEISIQDVLIPIPALDDEE